MNEKTNFFTKVKNIIGLGDLYDDFEDEHEDEDEKTEEESQKPEKTVYSKYNKSNKIVNIHTNSNLRLAIHLPEKYEDSPKIVTDLKNRKPVVVNLQYLDDELKRKVFDFISGSVFALEGNIQKVAKDVFILAPNNVEIDRRIKEELKNKGLFPWMK